MSFMKVLAAERELSGSTPRIYSFLSSVFFSGSGASFLDPGSRFWTTFSCRKIIAKKPCSPGLPLCICSILDALPVAKLPRGASALAGRTSIVCICLHE